MKRVGPSRQIGPSPQIGFVYFDLGNVLVSFDPQIACANVAELLGVDCGGAERAIYHSGLQHRYESGEVSDEEYVRTIHANLDRLINAESPITEQLLDAVSAMFEPIESMFELVKRVSESGIPVGVLSNTCRAHWQWIARQGYPAMQLPFQATVLSCEVGGMKPDSAIYEAAEQAAGMPAKRILFLDDRVENVVAARHRGWHAEQFIDAVQAETELRRYGVLGVNSPASERG